MTGWHIGALSFTYKNGSQSVKAGNNHNINSTLDLQGKDVRKITVLKNNLQLVGLIFRFTCGKTEEFKGTNNNADKDGGI